MKTLLNYPGAKWGMAKEIVALMPKHRSYLEPFFGSGAVLFNKPPSAIETVNDIDGDIVNFFKVLRENAEELANAIALTPYARDVFDDAHRNRGDTDFDRAYRFAIRSKMGHGIIRELPIYDGYNIMDDNVLGTSEQHFRAVIEMLRRQKEKAVFSGGLEPAMLQRWQAELLKSINPKTMYTAYDTKDDYDAIRQMAETMWDVGFSPRARQVKCYCLCGYEGDTFEEAEKRMNQIMDVGFLPFAMLYRDESGEFNKDWRGFQREWANSYIVGKKFSERRKEDGNQTDYQ